MERHAEERREPGERLDWKGYLIEVVLAFLIVGAIVGVVIALGG